MLNVLLVGVSVCDFIVTGIDRLAEPSGIVYLSNDVAISIGGHPCNIAIDLVKLGYDSKYINVVSAVGDDFCGIFIENTLRGYGVNTYLQKFYGVGSTKDVIIVFRGEDRRFHVYIGAASLLDPEYVLDVALRIRPRLVHIASGVISRVDDKLKDLLRIFRENGIVTFLDIGAAHPYGKKDWRFIIDSLEYVDIFHANVYEIRNVLSEENIAKAIDKLLSLGAKMVLITNGENGAYLANRNIAIYQPAFNVSVVDPTGAGDAFQAGFIYKLIEFLRDNLSSEEIERINDIEMLSRILLYAQAAGAVCVMAPGATTNVSRNSIENLLSKYGQKILRDTRTIR